MKRQPGGLQIGWQHISRKTRLLLVEVDGHQFKIDGGALLQFLQDVEQGETVLAAAHAHHHPVACLDHVVVNNRLPSQTAQAFFKLDGLAARARQLRRLIGRGRRRNFSRTGGKNSSRAGNVSHDATTTKPAFYA